MFFFFNDTATTEIYTLSLHDALPIWYTRAQVAQLSGLPPDRFRRLWHALGFAEAAEDDVVFTDDDVAALRTLSDLADAGPVGPGTEASFARALAQPLARLADWQAPLLADALARD